MSEPVRPRFQYGLRTLLLLFVVLGSSMAVFGAWGILVFGLTLALAVYLREAEKPVTLAKLLAVLIIIAGLVALLLPAVQTARESSRYSSCRNNLKQLALALLIYDQRHGSLPAAYTIDNNGKRLHSWRTQILPHADRSYLYNACDFTKPWDAPANKAVLSTKVSIFLCPSDPRSVPGISPTNYFAVVGPNTAWPEDKSRSLAEIGDKASHTILLVEAADTGVAWAEPKDVSLDELGASGGAANSLRLASHHHPSDNNSFYISFFYSFDCLNGVNVALADGSVTFLRTDNLSPDDLRQIFQIGGFTDDVIARQAGLDAGRRLNWPNIAALAVWLISVGALLTAAVRGRAGPIVKEQTAAVSVVEPARS